MGRPFVASALIRKKNHHVGNATWRTEMTTPIHREKPEDRHVRADRIAREFILSEKRERERKTARLRALRLELEDSAK
jgi:hypothetical protein